MPFGTVRSRISKVPLTLTAGAALVVAVLIAAVVAAAAATGRDSARRPRGLRPGRAQRVRQQAAAPVGGVLVRARSRWIGGGFDFVGGYFFAVSREPPAEAPSCARCAVARRRPSR